MADSTISKKHHPQGSLTRRILIVVVLLLVFPLLFQTFFLYRQEYKEKLNDVEGDLKLLASERAHFIEETVQMDWMWLERSHQPIPGRAQLSRNVKQLYIERIALPQNAPSHFVAISQHREALLVGVAESAENALVIAIPFKDIAKDMPRAYPIRIALLSEGEVVWESAKMQGDDLLEAEDPIGDTGISIQLSVKKSQIKELHLQSYYLRFASLLLFVGLIGGGAVFLFTRRIAKPLRHLCKTMDRVKEGGTHVRFKPDWMGFEINDLGSRFNETLDGLLHHAGEAARERLHRERLANELHIGHEIQASLLPKHVAGLPGVDIASGYFAAKEVNGDFYDLFKLPNGRLLIAMCDTAGKGISACLFALGLRSMIRSIASVETNLSEIIKKVNDLYILDAYELSMFATVWMGIYDASEKTLTYCSQGHPPTALVRGAQLEELWTAGIAIGAQQMDEIPTNVMQLQPGDLLVLYTDGIIEAHNLQNALFGKKRLYDLLMQKQKNSAQQIVTLIVEEVHAFANAAPQHDDMTLLVMRIEK